jgi:hypothetical protein
MMECFGNNQTCLQQLIPFWILDFRFWIVKQLVVIAFGYTSVAIIFQIGITNCSTRSEMTEL